MIRYLLLLIPFSCLAEPVWLGNVGFVYVDNPDKVCREMVNPKPYYAIGACMRFEEKGCVIYTREPHGINDTKTMTMIGHELWHCKGGMHVGDS